MINEQDLGAKTDAERESEARVFELSKPDVGVIQSSFGGGWVWPLNAVGTQALRKFFGEEPASIPVMGNEGAALLGYIVEPYQAGDLAEHLRSAGIVWKVD